MIKSVCWKLDINRLGEIKTYFDDKNTILCNPAYLSLRNKQLVIQLPEVVKQTLLKALKQMP